MDREPLCQETFTKIFGFRDCPDKLIEEELKLNPATPKRRGAGETPRSAGRGFHAGSRGMISLAKVSNPSRIG